MQQFWVRQTDAKRKTVWLLLLYAALLLVFGGIAAYGVTYVWQMFDPVRASRYWDGAKWVYTVSSAAYTRFLIVMLVVPLLIWGLSRFSPAAKGAGGKSVAESLDGALVSPQTTDFTERRLVNVVEEMAIASGVPVPPVYVLENEQSINAFAAGTNVNNAVIGVTRGTLEYLNREELQAVVAHEFSHILNQDMRLNMRFACLLFGLMCIAEIGKALIKGLGRSRPRSSSGRNSGQGLALLFAIALACFLIGLITHFFGTIIQAAVNRQREYLADASAVQFTRSPALASALKKIGGLTAGSKLTETGMASNYSHFFFCSAASSLFSSHPPLIARIKRIDPQWDGNFPEVKALSPEDESKKARKETSKEKAYRTAPGLAGIAVASRILAWKDSGLDDVAKMASSPSTCSEAMAKLNAACHEPLDSCYMIFGLLLDEDGVIREKQLASCDSEEAKKRMAEYKAAFDLVDPEEYVPLIERAVPALKRLSEEQYRAFYDIMRDLVFADDEMSFKEWILYRLIDSQVGAQYVNGGAQYVKPGKKAASSNVAQLEAAAVDLFAALAQLDTQDELARKAFAASLAALSTQKRDMPPVPSIKQLDASLTLLQQSSEERREATMLGAIMAVAADKTVTHNEAMFLRVLSLCLQVPLAQEIWAGSLAEYASEWINLRSSAKQ